MKSQIIKKSLIIAVITVLTLLTVCGCGSDSGNPSATAPGTNSGASSQTGSDSAGGEQNKTPAPATATPTPEPTATPLILTDAPEGYDANDKAPSADILDLVFENGEAKDASAANNKISELNSPAIKNDRLIDRDVAQFEGGEAGEDVMYAIYHTDKYKETLSDGFTFEVYARIVDDETYGVLIGYMQAGGAGIDYDPNNSANDWNTGSNCSIGFGVRDSADDSYVFLYREEPIETNRYYHIVGTFDGKTLCLYYDGVLIKTADIKGTLAHPSVEDPYIGIGGDMGEGLDGEDAAGANMAVARIYSEPLTPSQVYNRYLEVVKG